MPFLGEVQVKDGAWCTWSTQSAVGEKSLEPLRHSLLLLWQTQHARSHWSRCWLFWEQSGSHTEVVISSMDLDESMNSHQSVVFSPGLSFSILLSQKVDPAECSLPGSCGSQLTWGLTERKLKQETEGRERQHILFFFFLSAHKPFMNPTLIKFSPHSEPTPGALSPLDCQFLHCEQVPQVKK